MIDLTRCKTVYWNEHGDPVGVSLADFFKLASQSVPVVPDEKPTPAPQPVTPLVKTVPVAKLLGRLVGSFMNNKVYQASDGATPQNWYYEITPDGDVVPRGTNLGVAFADPALRLSGNDCPTGFVGVPASFTMPAGWDWDQFADKAYKIVPRTTGIKGPDWVAPTAGIGTWTLVK